jgi:hypothetical protein
MICFCLSYCLNRVAQAAAKIARDVLHLLQGESSSPG